ncbi:tail terminator [Salicola phage CGphi29]|uniref:tail terminator n=1 Tax=Salicola phage CGphi29 TaxID=754067 RepID=UPI0002C0B828|nr:tail terminator [Salicola phage CGphi29]AGH31821.1 hypothetical protein SLPG_00027 [Salicola phage CGphi29]
MSTNNDIKKAFYDKLKAANLGYDIAFPGVNFTPPEKAAWLEVTFAPNRGFDNGIPNSSTLVPQGMFQVACMDRPGTRGSFRAGEAADQVKAVFPKGESLTGSVRVSRNPYDLELDAGDDRLMIAVTVEYEG